MNTQRVDLEDTGCIDCNVIQLMTNDRAAMCESCERMMDIVVVTRVLPLEEEVINERIELCRQ